MDKNKTQTIKNAQQIINDNAQTLNEELNRLLLQEAEYVPALAYELTPEPSFPTATD